MKIIDFCKKGNLVRFYLGEDNLEKWWGDDFDDRPYEHNAGIVYDEYIYTYVDIVFPFTWAIYEPADDWHYNGNSPFCKEDFIKRKTPCIIAIPEKIVNDSWDTCYSEYIGNENVVRFYFGDEFKLEEYETTLLFNDEKYFKILPTVFVEEK